MLGGREAQLERLERGLEVLRPARADHDRRHLRMREQPGERERGRCRFPLERLGLEGLQRVEDAVVLQVEVRARGASSSANPAGSGSPRRYLPVSQPPASGLKGV